MPLMRYFSMIMLAILLTACGGGGSIQKDTNNGDDNTGGGFSLTLDFKGETNSLSPSNELIAIATLTNNGEPISGAVVTFETDAFSLIDSSSSVKMTTDADGNAQVTLQATAAEGQGVLTASYNQGDATLSKELAFVSEGLIELEINSTQSENNRLSRAVPLKVDIIVKENGNTVEGARVVFQVDQVATMLPESGAVLTNDEGIASVTLIATSIAGAGQLSATYESNGIVKTTEFNFTSVGDGGGDSSNPYQVTISAVNLDGDVSNVLGKNSPLLVTAELTFEGAPLVNERLQFQVDDFGVIEPESGFLLTDQQGKARVTLTASELVGAGRITVTYEEGQDAANQYFNFISEGATSELAIILSAKTEQGQESRELSAGSPLVVSAKLTKDNVALANKIITFESDDFATLIPSSGRVLTNAQGVAEITMQVTSSAGAGQLIARFSEGDESVAQVLNFSSSGDNANNKIKVESSLIVDCDEGWESSREQAQLDPVAGGCRVVNQVSSNESADIFVKVTSDQSTDGIKASLVKAESTLGQVLPATGTAITDSFGIALLKLQPGTQGGAGKVTVTSLDHNDVQDSFNFAIGVAELSVDIKNGLEIEPGNPQTGSFPLKAGGSTVIVVTLTDQEGNPVTSSIDVEFSSSCSSQTPALAELDELVSTSNGIAKSTYTAKGCAGKDTISVVIVNGSQTITQTKDIVVESAEAQAIQFLPEENGFERFIALPPGEGGIATQSVLSFKLLDEDNRSIAGARVDFKLSDDQGVAGLTQVSGNTNSNGIVRTTVKSGVVPGPLVVTACLIPQATIDEHGEYVTCWPELASQCQTNPNSDDRCPKDNEEFFVIPLSEQVYSVSSQLILSSGVTDQDSFSLSADVLNPNALNYDGVTSNLTLRFGDQFNQFSADGVAATILSEAGTIGSIDSTDTYECRTDNASCTVVWRSQGDRPFYGYEWGNRIGDIDGNPATHEGVAPRLRESLTTEAARRSNTNWNCDPYFGNPAPCIGGMFRQKNASAADSSAEALRRVVMGGRVSILAYVKGQESFRDEESILDGDGNVVTARRNGQFDVGEYRPEFDLTEAFIDTNENGRFDKKDCDSNAEPDPCSPLGSATGGHDDVWIDSNNNGLFDFDTDGDGSYEGDGLYNGLLCSEAALEKGECSRELVNVFRQMELVMSGDDTFVRFAVASNDCTSTSALVLETSGQSGLCDISTVDFNLAENRTPVTVYVYLSDEFGNHPPAGTEVAVSTTNGEIDGGSVSATVLNSNSDKPYAFSFTIKPETSPNESRSGQVSVRLTFPELGDSDSKVITLGPKITVLDAG
ncbi:hypothetical protein CWC29_008795 [Pseudoalteromonas sp. S4498]|uniref:Big-1 domain-containing protein n=1 Tax=Pseudoalteromonas galatheae TaxID=579562 RepID=A0A8T6YQ19_9GAMM|nr:hypothetical protein [Pseudoalteromonas galatheae]NKC18942.1 hypothetical protein [Pseudoalteromonas galatheae]